MGPQPGALSHPPPPTPCPSRLTLRHLLGADSSGREGPASGEQADPCEARGQCSPLLSTVGSSGCDFIRLNLPLCTPLRAGAAVLAQVPP